MTAATAATLACAVQFIGLGEPLALPPEDPSSRPPLKTVPQPADERRRPTWVGEHLSVGAGGSVVRGDYPATGVQIIGRAATLLQLLDVEAQLSYAALPGGSRAAVSVLLNMHPAFAAVVWRNMCGVLASGLHGYIGIGVARTVGIARTGGTARTGGPHASIGLPASLGVGCDIPLSSLERDSGLWLTARAGLRFQLVAVADDLRDYGGPGASLTIAWRWYDVFR